MPKLERELELTTRELRLLRSSVGGGAVAGADPHTEQQSQSGSVEAIIADGGAGPSSAGAPQGPLQQGSRMKM